MTTTKPMPPATRTTTPPAHVTLRAVAAWLESHRAAEVHYIDSGRVPGEFVVLGVLAGDDPSMWTRAAEIGPGWREDRAKRGVRLEWEIAPHATYRLVDAR